MNPYEELFTAIGKRKCLTLNEQEQSIAAANKLERAEVRTFALALAYSGCRISEALELTLEHVYLSSKSLQLRTLKQRNQTTYRSVPLPDHHLDALELVHRIRKQKEIKRSGRERPVSRSLRNTGWSEPSLLTA